LIVWVKVIHVGYVPEALNGDAVWFWELVLILIASGLHSRTSMIVAGVWVSSLLALSLIAGFAYRLSSAPPVAVSESPTREYQVTVALVADLLGSDEHLEVRVVRHAYMFDYRYARLCGFSGGGDLGYTVTWLGNGRFQVGEPGGPALTVKMRGNSYTFEDVGNADWHKC
jgi:hypothetical protein